MAKKDITNVLEHQLDKSNPVENKMLTLTKLVEQRLDAIEEKQTELSSDLKRTTDLLTSKWKETDAKLDTLINRFKDIDNKSIGYLTLLSQHPKLIKTMLILIGIVIALGGLQALVNTIIK